MRSDGEVFPDFHSVFGRVLTMQFYPEESKETGSDSRIDFENRCNVEKYCRQIVQNGLPEFIRCDENVFMF